MPRIRRKITRNLRIIADQIGNPGKERWPRHSTRRTSLGADFLLHRIQFCFVNVTRNFCALRDFCTLAQLLFASGCGVLTPVLSIDSNAKAGFA